ncbi:hypothetical protein [Dietzia sp. ANT_WB102]|uniref:hypothetical protein n=1 Tax=Dietzia sp. ANT_WB102 TaxID=2597345 RepID=UPI0011F05DD5|nr:hypothetical protein [Dietzia sp. ANT_WB102]KAA0918706.1 hypothetical protein FQ137_05115 [Dietzia sp. ANT_WB102]
MRSLVGPVPEPAERACSALRRCPRATLDPGTTTTMAPAPVALVHQVPGTSHLNLVIPTADATAIGSGGVRARLEVVDEILGGAAQGRRRRFAVVEGRVDQLSTGAQRHTATHIARDLPDSALLGVGSDSTLVRLRAERILLTDDDGVTDIAPDDLATSGPDPFTDLEGHWLDHLNDPRCQVVPRIALRVCRCLPAVRPLLVGIDRAGVDIELVDRENRVRRARLPFAEACTCVTELGTQLRLLAGGSRYPQDRAALRP